MSFAIYLNDDRNSGTQVLDDIVEDEPVFKKRSKPLKRIPKARRYKSSEQRPGNLKLSLAAGVITGSTVAYSLYGYSQLDNIPPYYYKQQNIVLSYLDEPYSSYGYTALKTFHDYVYKPIESVPLSLGPFSLTLGVSILTAYVVNKLTRSKSKKN